MPVLINPPRRHTECKRECFSFSIAITSSGKRSLNKAGGCAVWADSCWQVTSLTAVSRPGYLIRGARRICYGFCKRNFRMMPTVIVAPTLMRAWKQASDLRRLAFERSGNPAWFACYAPHWAREKIHPKAVRMRCRESGEERRSCRHNDAKNYSRY